MDLLLDPFCMVNAHVFQTLHSFLLELCGLQAQAETRTLIGLFSQGVFRQQRRLNAPGV